MALLIDGVHNPATVLKARHADVLLAASADVHPNLMGFSIVRRALSYSRSRDTLFITRHRLGIIPNNHPQTMTANPSCAWRSCHKPTYEKETAAPHKGNAAFSASGDAPTVLSSAWDIDGGAMIVGAGAVPEPTSGLLLLLGISSLALRRKPTSTPP